jgi:hypothetical protein
MVQDVALSGLDPEPVLGRQVDAVLRAIALLHSKKHDLTFVDVLGALAHAEDEAQYTCGFILIFEDATYVEKLKKHLVDQEYIAIDPNGLVSLGVNGKTRAAVTLPTPIEEQLALL